jgi:hypothetical protein
LSTNSSTPIAAVVGPGVEYSVTYNATFYADFGPDTLSLGITGVFTNIGSNLVYDFTNLNWTAIAANIGNVSLTHSDFSDVTFSFGPDSIHVEIPEQALPHQLQTVDFLITPTSAVPEPSSLALLGVSGIGLVISAYRRRRAAV